MLVVELVSCARDVVGLVCLRCKFVLAGGDALVLFGPIVVVLALLERISVRSIRRARRKS